MKGLSWIVPIILLTPVSALPQTTKKIPVAVVHWGDDQIGKSFVFYLKEAIRTSQSFKYEPLPSTPRIVVYLVSVEIQRAGHNTNRRPTTVAYNGMPSRCLGRSVGIL